MEKIVVNKNDDAQIIENLAKAYNTIKSELSKVIVGQEKVINELIVSMLCKGHSLIIGVPGLAKTLMVSTLSRIMDLKFNRVQFTPDLMPSDITGTEVLEENRTTGEREFRFIQGPVFTNILLADEINRTPPKTQAALLQAMQELQVTVGGKTFSLPKPFFVLATQNPIEQEGTYPLPEAQLDRFMFSIYVDYPTYDEELEIVKMTTSAKEFELKPMLKAEEIFYLQQLVRKVPVADNVVEYAVKLVTATRKNSEQAPDFVKNYVSWGAGPRASQYLILASKARAILDGRLAPKIEDVVDSAYPVLRHRIITNFSAEAEGIDSQAVINYLVTNIK